jgi:Asp/Glu/hydantoin racemase
MQAIASDVAGTGTIIEAITAGTHEAITDEASLAEASIRVAALAPLISSADAVVIAGFGDPGLSELRAAGVRNLTGLAEAGMAEAAAGARRFAVVTTTPALVERISQTARALGHSGYAGTWVTEGDPIPLMADEGSLAKQLLATCSRACIDDCSIDAIVIGGGPLAAAARLIAPRFALPLIEPLPAAVRRVMAHSSSSTQ